MLWERENYIPMMGTIFFKKMTFLYTWAVGGFNAMQFDFLLKSVSG